MQDKIQRDVDPACELQDKRAFIAVMGVDVSKAALQIYAVDGSGALVERRSVPRQRVASYFKSIPPCLIGIEAGGSGHHWGRELRRLGHDVRLIAPAKVSPFVIRDKTDANDAEAICEVVRRPGMLFVPIKSVEAQAVLTVHRCRRLLIKQRTQIINMLRSFLAEFGTVFSIGAAQTIRYARRVADGEFDNIPVITRALVADIILHLEETQERIAAADKQLASWFCASDDAKRLATIPGIGVLTATALVASVPEPNRFRNSRQFASWLGLTPRQRSSGAVKRLGPISRRGDPYLRQLLVLGCTSMIREARAASDKADKRCQKLLERRPPSVVRVAMAARNARIAWAVMTKGGTYADSS